MLDLISTLSFFLFTICVMYVCICQKLYTDSDDLINYEVFNASEWIQGALCRLFPVPSLSQSASLFFPIFRCTFIPDIKLLFNVRKQHECSKIVHCTRRCTNPYTHRHTQMGIIKVLLETFWRITNRFHSSENIMKFYGDLIQDFQNNSYTTVECRMHISFSTTFRMCSWFMYRLNVQLAMQILFESRIFTVGCNWFNYSSVVSDTHSFPFTFQKTSTNKPKQKRDTYV